MHAHQDGAIIHIVTKATAKGIMDGRGITEAIDMHIQAIGIAEVGAATVIKMTK